MKNKKKIVPVKKNSNNGCCHLWPLWLLGAGLVILSWYVGYQQQSWALLRYYGAGTLARPSLLRLSQMCSIGLRSELRAGDGKTWIPSSWRYSMRKLAECQRALSCMNLKLWPRNGAKGITWSWILHVSLNGHAVCDVFPNHYGASLVIHCFGYSGWSKVFISAPVDMLTPIWTS